MIPWSYRSSPVEALTYSPFTLLFGGEPTTAVSLLHDGWISKSMLKLTKKHVLNYIVELRDKLQNVHDITLSETQIARNKSETYYDRLASNREFEVGQLVLIYIPAKGEPLKPIFTVHAKFFKS